MASASMTHDGKTVVHFGSCSRPDLAQPLWEHVLARDPALWIWAGDAIYADEFDHMELFPWPEMKFKAGNISHIQHLYNKQQSVEGYAQLLQSSTAVIGTWDDHDFGVNDADRSYAYREESKQKFLDFIGEPASSSRRNQEGLYAAHHYDFPGGGSILVVLLDVRYNRDPYGTDGGDFLGEEQWQWLTRVLSESTARVHLIVSSLQVMQGRQGLGENWVRFPEARERLLRLLTSRDLRAPILLSGDVHMGEFSAATCSGGRLLE
eukprot:4780650-Amphidinium_carterae.1